MSGDMSDNELNEAKEAFGLGDSPVRLLVASDVAAEGLNLHFQCHRLVHFDLPWSLMTFQQRNGRIDRYGQQSPAPDCLSVHPLPGGADPQRPADPPASGREGGECPR